MIPAARTPPMVIAIFTKVEPDAMDVSPLGLFRLAHSVRLKVIFECGALILVNKCKMVGQFAQIKTMSTTMRLCSTVQQHVRWPEMRLVHRLTIKVAMVQAITAT